jgi:hypothetical protein
LLTGFSKVIGQKVDKKFEKVNLFVRPEAKHADEDKTFVVYGTQGLTLQNLLTL